MKRSYSKEGEHPATPDGVVRYTRFFAAQLPLAHHTAFGFVYRALLLGRYETLALPGNRRLP